jgi:hypothetical protein
VTFKNSEVMSIAATVIVLKVCAKKNMMVQCSLKSFCIWGLLVTCSTTNAAHDNVWQPAQDNAQWRAECGSCHMVFSPGLMVPEDWLDIMSGLDRHFGVDASVDTKVRVEVSEFLKQNAASIRVFESRDQVPRITTSDWFVGKHRSAIRLWTKGKIKSLSDCGVCHMEADSATPQ